VISGMKHHAVEKPVEDPTDAVRQARESHAVLRYTTLRLAIFLVALALLWLVRVRGLLLVALAVLISGLASYALLQRQRDLMSVQLAAASARRRDRAAARAAREDAVADELAADGSGVPGPDGHAYEGRAE
jgi:hypothetical protein